MGENISDTIRDRRTVRIFREKSLSRDIILRLVDAACNAPAGGNTSKWNIIVVTDRNLKERIRYAALNQEFLLACSVIFVFIGGRVKNTFLAVENLLLEAHSLGLEGCVVGSFDEKIVAEILGIPRNINIHILVAIGEPKEGVRNPGKRFPLEVIHWNKYGVREISIDLLRKIVLDAQNKVKDFLEQRKMFLEKYGEKSFEIYRLEEKYSAFVFRPILERIVELMRELNYKTRLAEKILEKLREYGEGRWSRISSTNNINSREVVEWERRYSTKIFPEIIENILREI